MDESMLEMRFPNEFHIINGQSKQNGIVSHLTTLGTPATKCSKEIGYS